MDPGDADLTQTALRETREELGVDPSKLQLLGRLPSFSVLVSGYLIAPFVAWSPSVPLIRPDPLEVAEVFEVPVADLLDPTTIVDETWEMRGGQWRVIFYRIGEQQIWGATARILWDFAARFRGHDRAPDLGPGSVLPA
jgi:8-oxo-dGTP pyrophosphatase MutT (NUDIX family)